MSSHLKNLQNALQLLPTIGQKSADRLTNFLLKNRNIAQQIANTLEQTKHIVQCKQCRNWSDTPLCKICANHDRPYHQLCIVVHPGEQQMIEQLGVYQGRYLILHALFSPIDNIGPQALKLDDLSKHIHPNTQEVILTLPGSPEGEITANYLSKKLLEISPNIKLSRLAQGIPIGSELGLIDPQTMMHALNTRQTISL